VAVTIAVVGIALTLLIEGLNGSKIRAAHTRNSRLARDLGLYTLGQVASRTGEFSDELDDRMNGTYAELDLPDWEWEVLLGEEQFDDAEESADGRFDSWRDRDEEEDEEEDEDAEQPYEKVRVRVRFPRLLELTNHMDLERWLPWDTVHADLEDAGREEDS
jgi:hypothetical protein